MEASALTHASRRGLLARRSPLLKLQGDERLIAMARAGNPGAFEAIVDRYQGRLLGFCRQMLGSTEDAEDVLQEVFVNAYRAMLADEREINLRPWLYRIARNRCLNHLRKPTADAQESMDMVPAVEASSTAEKVHNREEFRQLLTDVGKLPETQRTALLLREMDAMSYEEIAQAMETSVPSVKSLLVRARISLAEASQARQLTCGEVRVDLAEASEGLRKLTGPVRRHVRDCDECSEFRSQLRSNDKVLAAIAPVGPLLALKGFILSKLGLGGAGAGGAATGAGATGAGAVGGVSAAALGGSGAASGLGALGGAIGTKAVAGVVTAAVITAGAVEVKQQSEPTPVTSGTARTSTMHRGPAIAVQPHVAVATKAPQPQPVTSIAVTPPPEAAAPSEVPPPASEPTDPEAATEPSATGDDDAKANSNSSTNIGDSTPSAGAGAPAGGGTVVVTVGGAGSEAAAPPAESPPPAAESPPPAAEAAPAPPAPPPASTSSTTPESEQAGPAA
ncbi:MAG TPA: sigma-70 family RNA polymerase sigma factor [Solirubrobacterales bacterium]